MGLMLERTPTPTPRGGERKETTLVFRLGTKEHPVQSAHVSPGTIKEYCLSGMEGKPSLK